MLPLIKDESAVWTFGANTMNIDYEARWKDYLAEDDFKAKGDSTTGCCCCCCCIIHRAHHHPATARLSQEVVCGPTVLTARRIPQQGGGRGARGGAEACGAAR